MPFTLVTGDDLSYIRDQIVEIDPNITEDRYTSVFVGSIGDLNIFEFASKDEDIADAIFDILCDESESNNDLVSWGTWTPADPREA